MYVRVHHTVTETRPLWTSVQIYRNNCRSANDSKDSSTIRRRIRPHPLGRSPWCLFRVRVKPAAVGDKISQEFVFPSPVPRTFHLLGLSSQLFLFRGHLRRRLLSHLRSIRSIEDFQYGMKIGQVTRSKHECLSLLKVLDVLYPTYISRHFTPQHRFASWFAPC